MREILFKAKRIDNGEWVEGYIFRLSEKHHPFIMLKDRLGEGYEVDENTICQYTGLTDKNGNKIWENDIMQYHSGGDKVAIKYGEYRSCYNTQKVCHVGFYVDWKARFLRKDLGYWVKMTDCNIVGNIFDNPELLE